MSSTPCSLKRLRLSRSAHSSPVQVLEKASGKKTSATGLLAAEVAQPDVLAELVGEVEVGSLGVVLQSHERRVLSPGATADITPGPRGVCRTAAVRT